MILAVAHAQLSSASLARLGADWRQHLLGVARIGQAVSEQTDDLPVQNVLMPLLGGATETINEAWFGAGVCRAGVADGIAFRRNDHTLYGVINLDERSFHTAALPLQQAVEDAYQRIFALLDREACPYLWRTWNYFADINSECNGLERYRQFNVGRHKAFLDNHRLTPGAVPAASALGTRTGPLTIAFMAGRVAPLPIENPRQVSAYHYPDQYGPVSPTFSRAVRVALPEQELLFISGTASIVGHQTMHVGDVAAQTQETINNIFQLLAAAAVTTGASITATLNLRVYIRHAKDYPEVRAIVEDRFGQSVSAIYVQADVCRGDLLVEIEALSSGTPPPSFSEPLA